MGFLIEEVDAEHIAMVATADRRDVQAVADHCAAMRSIGAGNGKDDKLAMTVPGWVVNDWCVRKGITFAQFMGDRKIQTRFLDDPDNANFRIWQGRI